MEGSENFPSIYLFPDDYYVTASEQIRKFDKHHVVSQYLGTKQSKGAGI